MSSVMRLMRQTLTIARRDFTATVFTPMFLVFLLSPLIMLTFSTIGALGSASFAHGSDDIERIVAVVAPEDGKALASVDARLRPVVRARSAPGELKVEAAGATPEAQARAAFAAKDYEALAVLWGPLDHPHILYAPGENRSGGYLAALAEQALRDRAAGGAAPLSHPEMAAFRRSGVSVGGHNQAAFFAVFGIFFLTLFLSGQAVGTMAEERSNKVIEILAAAVPLEAVFLGKLLGMFGSALLFVSFWGALVAKGQEFLPPSMAELAAIGPAVGAGPFALLFASYFAMAYLLLGAVFLSVGAQASSQREIQMLSLPITVTQMLMFALASAAASKPGSVLATVAEIFPLSSPFAMAAHAANRAELWPHFLAIAWQLLWVVIVIRIGAAAFRRGVLKSGGKRRGLAFRRAG